MGHFELCKSRRGTSLVEVLVVMVVLLVGIMTVIQMFPTGFSVLKAAESQTIATRLAQQELERWKSMAANLPDGIVPIDETGIVINDQDPGPPFEAFLKNPDGSWQMQTVDGVPRYCRGNAYNVRQVCAESTLIPTASQFQTGGTTNYGSRYALGFGPIDIVRDPPGTGPLKNLVIKSGDLGRVAADHDAPPPYLRAGQYAIDYELVGGSDFGNQQVFHVSFPKDPGVAKRLYYISYSFNATLNSGEKPELFSVISQPVYRNANPYKTIKGDDDDWIEVPIDISGLPAGGEIESIERYSDRCARGFIENPDAKTNINSWGTVGGTYEFYIADSLLGVIAFNPAAHGLSEYTARGVRPIQARIDYQIYDLRIIREERVIPQSGAGATEIPIKMSLRFILDAGDPGNQTDGSPTDNPGEETFEGLVNTTDGGKALSVIVVDLATGLRVDDNSISHASALDLLPIVNVDCKSGVVKLPVNADLMDANGTVVMANTPLAGRHLRFYYRAEGDWSVQCTKAYAAYSRKYITGTPSYNEFKFDGANRLTFARCEIGKTVLVDYTYVDETSGAESKVVGESHKIDVDPANGNICVDLKVPDGTTIPKGARIIVIGASFTARVIWRDGTRWRNVDLDTYLMRQ